MGIANHFIHLCDIKRPYSGSDDAHGLSDETQSFVDSGVRFRLVEKRERIWKSEESESAVITTYTGFFDPDEDLEERDELVNIILENGTTVDEKYVIKSLLVRRARSARHLSAELQEDLVTKIKGKGFELNWKGDQVVEEVEDKAILILADFGLAVEGKAKQELQPGHGVKTGTLRRSIHTAGPDYNWAADNVEPSKSTPNLGGKIVKAVRKGKQLVVAVGSGLVYAMTVHQGHDDGSFEGYHYLTIGLEKARSQLKNIIARHKV